MMSEVQTPVNDNQPSQQGSDTAPLAFAPPTGLIALELVARLHQAPLDMRALVREFGVTEAEISPAMLIRMARQTGFKARYKANLPAAGLLKAYPTPAIGVIKEPTGEQHYLVLLKHNAENGKALCFSGKARTTCELAMHELPSQWIIMYPRAFNSNIAFGLKWFFDQILHYKTVIAEVLLGAFIVQLFGLSTPLFTQVILDKVIVHQSMTTLNVLAVGFLVIVLFEFILNLVRNYLFAHTANKIDARLGARLFRHLLALPFPFFEVRKVGVLQTKVRELETIRNFFTQKAVSVLIDGIFSVVFVVMMGLYSPLLTGIALGFVALISIVYFILTPTFRKLLEEKFEKSAKSNAYLVEAMTGVQTVKSLAIEGMMQRRWEDFLGDYLKSNFDIQQIGQVANALTGALRQLMTISILFFGVQQVTEKQLTVGQLIAFNMLAGQFIGPVLRLTGLWHEFQQALLGVDRLGEILNHPTETAEQGITLPQLMGQIEVKDMTFRYSLNGPNALDGLCMTIPAGHCVGVVGRSGSGKSTLTKLVQRLYLPNSGTIFVDGMDSRHFNTKWYRQQIGVVLQENYLFSGTIRENIAMARPDAPMELIIEAAKLAGAHDFITQMPEGYDTIVEERGSSLSGGQRQRIAIARALITNPRIIIFDEATSSLDNDSERLIIQTIQRLRKGRTIIIVAHRLSTIAICDTLYVLDRGRLVEEGSPQDLIQKGGVFYELATSQHGRPQQQAGPEEQGSHE